jgi:CheY-like chemotaxis protein
MPLHAILIAEEKPVNLPAVREHLREVGIKDPLITFKDGEDLQNFLCAVTTGRGATVRPRLLLFDLDLPNSNGFEFLRWMRQQDSLQELSVVILARTIDHREVERAAALGVTQFGPKHPAPRVMADLIARALGAG